MARQLWRSSSGHIEIELEMDDAASVSQPGKDAQEDVTALRRVPYVSEQLDRIGADLLRRELMEYGCWDSGELADHEMNLDRLLWIAGCDIREES